MKSALIFLLSFAFSLEVVRAVGLTSRRMRTNTKSISECQTCEYIMKFVRFQTVSRGQSVEAIKEKIKALLKLTPSSAQHEEYLRNIETYVKMTRNGKSPRKICQLVSNCSTKQLELPRMTGCDVCTAVVDLIKFEIKLGNVTVQLVVKAVEVMCALIGDVPVYQECKLILTEINKVIQWIEQQVTPTDICERLGFCNNTMPAVNSDFAIMRFSSNVLCEMCKTAVNMVDSELQIVETRLDAFEDDMNAVCNIFGRLAVKCKSVVGMFADEVKRNLLYIEAELDPSTTCKALCPASLNN